jgi:hypothetical protein
MVDGLDSPTLLGWIAPLIAQVLFCIQGESCKSYRGRGKVADLIRNTMQMSMSS